MGLNVLLTADWHLTDNPRDEYRWRVFENAAMLGLEHDCRYIIIAGDFVDRKDKHGAELLNRVARNLRILRDETGAKIIILGGNHDLPLKGTPYWDILNEMGIVYLTAPQLVSGILWCLPFSSNPLEDWKDVPLHSARAVIMHQTVAGSIVEGGRVIESATTPMPIFPRGVPVFSGDVHRPQVTNGVTYIGIPHPTRFSEDWGCRMLVVKNSDFRNPVAYAVPTIRRAILEVESVAELYQQRFRPGDQVRIRFKLKPSNLTNWAGTEQTIRDWAEKQEILVASIEVLITKELEQTTNETNILPQSVMLAPREVMQLFGDSEKLPALVLEQGMSILGEALSA